MQLLQYSFGVSVDQVAPLIVPLFPLLVKSFKTFPFPSLKFQKPTSPVSFPEGGQDIYS